MDVFEAIAKRCSVRNFQAKALEADKLNQVLEAGRLAPSGNNRQAWRFVVATDDQLRQSLAAACEQPFVAKAPAVIAVVGFDPAGVMTCGIPRDAVDCSIAVSYMTLAATALGLGTCWIGHFDQDACRGLLRVPLTAKIVALLAVGYPDEPSRPKTRKPMNEIVSYQKF